MIKLKNKQIAKYLKEKDDLVTKGRAISVELEELDKKIDANNKKQLEITAKVDPKELVKEGEALQKKINKDLETLNEVGNKIMKAKLDGIPEEVKKEFFVLKTEHESLEKERNKIALKVQKIKDRVIPIIQRECKPQLSEYEDIESTEIRGDNVLVKTFDHLEEFKAKFKKKV